MTAVAAAAAVNMTNPEPKASDEVPANASRMAQKAGVFAVDGGATSLTGSIDHSAAGTVAGSSATGGSGGADGSPAGAGGASTAGAQPDAALGRPCAGASDCQGHACTDGVCCTVQLCPTCQVCGSEGLCQQITDLTSATAASRCARVGGSCRQDSACITGNCTDEVCCAETSCDICYSCGVEGATGKCTAVSGSDDPRGCTHGRMCNAGQCADIVAEELRTATGTTLGGGADRLAQTVRIASPGQLVAVRLAVDCARSIGFEVAVYSVDYDGGPGQARLAQTELGSFEVAPALLHFPLVSPLPVTAGSELALVVSLNKPNSRCQLWGSGTNSYPGGDGFKWMSDDNKWVALGADLAMQVLVQP